MSARHRAPAETVTSNYLFDRIAALEARVDWLTERNFVLTARVIALEARAAVEVAPDEDLITVKDASHRTGLSVSGVHQRLRKGRIFGRKVGGRVLIKASSL